MPVDDNLDGLSEVWVKLLLEIGTPLGRERTRDDGKPILIQLHDRRR